MSRQRKYTLHEVMTMLEDSPDSVPSSGVDIFLQPPENACGDITDEDSVDEDILTINNLPASLLRADAERKELSDDESQPTTSSWKPPKKKMKVYTWNKSDLAESAITSRAWVTKDIVKIDKSPIEISDFLTWICAFRRRITTALLETNSRISKSTACVNCDARGICDARDSYDARDNCDERVDEEDDNNDTDYINREVIGRLTDENNQQLNELIKSNDLEKEKQSQDNFTIKFKAEGRDRLDERKDEIEEPKNDCAQIGMQKMSGRIGKSHAKSPPGSTTWCIGYENEASLGPK
ncbi:hypothetical protein HELRODRAFT_174265 [Helobdella robusta]|uniref:PiggyBac transposable element-derived protein domain-containing protein n=1 Tax=Helobdella robusta TaxID=6412 RepID=T1F7W7_HELRO|nr:hypothetical protein HELRODRAFT_174265 [Helobdella robusta]ESO02836.1 hypothetical protein HELRODRAFT_174265 [Helobdella robusta]